MKLAFFVTLLVLSACRVSTPEARFNVGSRAYTGTKFYLGSGTLTVQDVVLKHCNGNLEYQYRGTLQTQFGVIEDVEACESELE